MENFTEDALLSPPTKRVCTKASTIRTKSSDSRRWRFKHIALHMQIILSIIWMSLLPAVCGLARTAMKGASNLSPFENAFLRSRLDEIKIGIEKDYSARILADETGTQTFIFPGAGGVDPLVLELQASNPGSKIIDWKDYRGNFLTASYDSEAVGEAVAGLVLESIKKSGDGDNKETLSVSNIRFIGVSVGAFAANAAATVVYKQTTANSKTTNEGDSCDPVGVDLILLDPFCARGVAGPNYGRDFFGKHATTALQILNTDDPVPTTNDPLPFCYCIDVTDAPEKQDFVLLPGDSMHSWPLAYFARHYSIDYTTDAASTNFPRGIVKKVA